MRCYSRNRRFTGAADIVCWQCIFHEAASVGSDATLLLADAGGRPTATKETENELQSNTTTSTYTNNTQGLPANRSGVAAKGNHSSA